MLATCCYLTTKKVLVRTTQIYNSGVTDGGARVRISWQAKCKHRSPTLLMF